MNRFIFGMASGALFVGELNTHGFLQAMGVTAVFIIVIVIIYKWITGEFDKAEEDWHPLDEIGKEK